MNSQPAKPSFTAKQGHYLAFIHAYTQVIGRSPAEADMQRHFRVTPPSVHQMVLALERQGLITRQPGVARSIILRVSPEILPPLAPQPFKSSVQGYAWRDEISPTICATPARSSGDREIKLW